MKKLTLKIDGMACSMCESHVNDAVRRAERVRKVTSSHKTGECVIIAECPDEGKITAALEGAGYRVLSAVEEPYEKRGFFSSLLGK